MALLKNITVIGDKELIKQATLFLICNWEGHVYKVTDSPTRQDIEPIDKGSTGCFGVNSNGAVIFGVCLYPGNERSKIPEERGPHLYIEKN